MKGLQVVGSGDVNQTQKFSSEFFHRVNRILPVDQEVFAVPPDMEVRTAISLMEENVYSHSVDTCLLVAWQAGS
jgi:hypothetical protein